MKYGIDPRIFVRQIAAESNFNPRARSPAGARGIAQIMSATARGWGVNPDDPVASLDAAARNMARYLRSYGGSYEKALSAYNAGPGAVQKYGGVPPYAETRGYVRKILGGDSRVDTMPNPVAPPAPGRDPGLSRLNRPHAGAGAGGSAPFDMSRLLPLLMRARRQALAGQPFDRGALLAAMARATRGRTTPQGPPAGTTPRESAPMYGDAPAPGGGGSVTAPGGRVIGTPRAGTHNLGNWQSDNALDIALPVGSPVFAAFDGTIDPARYGSLGSSNPRMAGLRATLRGGGNSVYYAHLSRLAVKPGQRVRRGDVIGYSGTANGVGHLHFGVESGDPRRYYLGPGG